MFDTLR
jgi:hypothetical protein